MSTITPGTDLLPSFSFLSYCEGIMTMCKAIRQTGRNSLSYVIYVFLSVKSGLPFVPSFNVLVSLASRVGRMSMSHAAFWSLLMGREDCLDCWQAGSRTCTKQRVFTVGLLWRATAELEEMYETGKQIHQKEAETKNSAGYPAQARIEWCPQMLEGIKCDASP